MFSVLYRFYYPSSMKSEENNIQTRMTQPDLTFVGGYEFRPFFSVVWNL